MTKETYYKYEKYFWWCFILLPIVVGLVRYNWLSVEPYISRTSQPVSTQNMETAALAGVTEAPVLRKLKGQEAATNKEDFIHNRYLEVFQFAVFSFLYGLMGCVFYSYGQVIKGIAPNFVSAFGKSIIIAFLFSIFFVISTL